VIITNNQICIVSTHAFTLVHQEDVGYFTDCVFSPNMQYVILCRVHARDTETLHLWQIFPVWTRLSSFSTGGWKQKPCAFSVEQQLIAIIENNVSVILWNYLREKVILSVECTGFKMIDCAFSTDGQFLMGQSIERMAVWSVGTGEIMLHVPGEVNLPHQYLSHQRVFFENNCLLLDCGDVEGRPPSVRDVSCLYYSGSEGIYYQFFRSLIETYIHQMLQ